MVDLWATTSLPNRQTSLQRNEPGAPTFSQRRVSPQDRPSLHPLQPRIYSGCVLPRRRQDESRHRFRRDTCHGRGTTIGNQARGAGFSKHKTANLSKYNMITFIGAPYQKHRYLRRNVQDGRFLQMHVTQACNKLITHQNQQIKLHHTNQHMVVRAKHLTNGFAFKLLESTGEGLPRSLCTCPSDSPGRDEAVVQEGAQNSLSRAPI